MFFFQYLDAMLHCALNDMATFLGFLATIFQASWHGIPDAVIILSNIAGYLVFFIASLCMLGFLHVSCVYLFLLPVAHIMKHKRDSNFHPLDPEAWIANETDPTMIFITIAAAPLLPALVITYVKLVLATDNMEILLLLPMSYLKGLIIGGMIACVWLVAYGIWKFFQALGRKFYRALNGMATTPRDGIASKSGQRRHKGVVDKHNAGVKV